MKGIPITPLPLRSGGLMNIFYISRVYRSLFSQFLTKPFVVDTHSKHLKETLLISNLNLLHVKVRDLSSFFLKETCLIEGSINSCIFLSSWTIIKNNIQFQTDLLGCTVIIVSP